VFRVDFSERFAPFAYLNTIKMLFALASQKGLKNDYLDAKFAFLNGYL